MHHVDPLAPSYERERSPLCALGILLCVVTLGSLVWVLIEFMDLHAQMLLG